jgi:cardiolipin synthase
MSPPSLPHDRPSSAARPNAPARFEGTLPARAPALAGHRITLLSDAKSFSAMFEAMDRARDHINIEGGLIEAEGPGRQMARRLAAKRREGVKVHLLFDRSSCRTTAPGCVEMLREAGVRMCGTRTPLVAWPAQLLRARGPGKLLIVDGRVAFTCGIQVEGPVVASLQQRFIDDWVARTGERPLLAHYFPRLRAAGDQLAALEAGAGGSCSLLHGSLLRAVDLAQDRIGLVVVRFLPSRPLLQALVRAAQRGVQVRIFERQRAPLQRQIAVIDGVWASIGSRTLDAPAELVVIDRRFAGELEGRFAQDLVANLDTWQQRPLAHRLLDALARRLERWL